MIFLTGKFVYVTTEGPGEDEDSITGSIRPAGDREAERSGVSIPLMMTVAERAASGTARIFRGSVPNTDFDPEAPPLPPSHLILQPATQSTNFLEKPEIDKKVKVRINTKKNHSIPPSIFYRKLPSRNVSQTAKYKMKNYSSDLI